MNIKKQNKLIINKVIQKFIKIHMKVFSKMNLLQDH